LARVIQNCSTRSEKTALTGEHSSRSTRKPFKLPILSKGGGIPLRDGDVLFHSHSQAMQLPFAPNKPPRLGEHLITVRSTNYAPNQLDKFTTS